MTTGDPIPAGYVREGRLLVRYELAWNPADQTVTVIRAIRAGIDGPWSHAEGVVSREQAEKLAFSLGLIVDGPWEITTSGTHFAPLNSFRN